MRLFEDCAHHQLDAIGYQRSQDWPEGHYSTATFELTKSKDGIQLAFTQTGVPENKYAEISKGWQSQYWDKMKAALED